MTSLLLKYYYDVSVTNSDRIWPTLLPARLRSSFKNAPLPGWLPDPYHLLAPWSSRQSLWVSTQIYHGSLTEQRLCYWQYRPDRRYETWTPCNRQLKQRKSSIHHHYLIGTWFNDKAKSFIGSLFLKFQEMAIPEFYFRNRGDSGISKFRNPPYSWNKIQE